MRNFFRIQNLALLFCFLSSGCMETAAQREGVRMQSEQTQLVQPFQECAAPLLANPSYAKIVAKTGLSATETTISLEMLNDPSFPTKEDIKNMYALYSEVQDCRKIILEAASKTHPLLLMSWVQTFSESDKLWADFTKGKTPWGKFNEARKALLDESKARRVQVSMEINNQLQNQHGAEMQQRQRAAEALSQWAAQQQAFALQQQAINAANRPHIINCNYFGNTAQCNSN